MAGSEAEERVRAKAEALLRRLWPDARIIHELQLEQGGVRIDIAAVSPDRIVAVEIKSERDGLKRLERQIRRALDVADQVWVCVAQKHGEPCERFRDYPIRSDFETEEAHAAAYRAYRAMRRVRLWVEAGTDGAMEEATARNWGWSGHIPDPRERFDLLWADEQRRALGRHFGLIALPSSKGLTRAEMTRQAIEHMTGAEMRRAVCLQLRERRFPRADPPASEIEAAKEVADAKRR